MQLYEARRLICDKIEEGAEINTADSGYRFVLKVDIDSDKPYKVRIGRESGIWICWRM